MGSEDEIRALLQTFQAGYTLRDLSRVDAFMDLFTPDAEAIGTNGIRPGEGEWYTHRAAARELVEGDWKDWGDLLLDLETASIRAVGDVGWVAATATVTMTIGEENYAWFLKFICDYIDTSQETAEQKLNYILRGGANTIYELRRGEHFVWPLRFTAVVVRHSGTWKFAQMHFSFPTTNFPDVRSIV